MGSESLRTVRDRFSEFIERVQKHHERVVVTRNGTPAAIVDRAVNDERLTITHSGKPIAELRPLSR